jgi:hypothetical protein
MTRPTQIETIIKVRARLTDLQHDGNGYCENGASVTEVELTFTALASNAQIARAVKTALGIRGWRTDGWCHADFVWRNGCMGAYADIEVVQ